MKSTFEQHGQRIEISAVRTGRAQAWITDLQLTAGKYSRITFAARTPAGGAIEIGVRLQGPPYTSLWDKRFRLSPEWRRCEALIPPLPLQRGAAYALMIYPGLGITDLDAITLQTIDVDALVAHAPRKEGNLLNARSFPIGLPSPCSLTAGLIGAAAAADPAVLGPRGLPALKLTPGFTDDVMRMVSHGEIVSGPIASNQCRPHTVSLDAKGVKEGQRIWVEFTGPGGPADRRKFTVGTAVQHVVATLKVPFIVEGFMLLKVGSKDPL